MRGGGPAIEKIQVGVLTDACDNDLVAGVELDVDAIDRLIDQVIALERSNINVNVGPLDGTEFILSEFFRAVNVIIFNENVPVVGCCTVSQCRSRSGQNKDKTNNNCRYHSFEMLFHFLLPPWRMFHLEKFPVSET